MAPAPRSHPVARRGHPGGRRGPGYTPGVAHLGAGTVDPWLGRAGLPCHRP